MEIKTCTDHNWNSQSNLTSYTININAAIQLLAWAHSLKKCYILIVAWAQVICLICTYALRPWTCMLQLLHAWLHITRTIHVFIIPKSMGTIHYVHQMYLHTSLACNYIFYISWIIADFMKLYLWITKKASLGIYPYKLV